MRGDLNKTFKIMSFFIMVNPFSIFHLKLEKISKTKITLDDFRKKYHKRS